MNKPRISLVGADCEQSCRRWTIGNFADDSGVFVIKDESCKIQQIPLPGPWTGRGHLSCLTREEEVMRCLQTWRGAECVLVQRRICATKTVQEEDGSDFRDAATRRLISAELRRFSTDSVTVHPADVVCRSGISLKNQQKVRGKCKPLVNHVCSLIREQLRRGKLVFLGAPWPAWTLDLPVVKKIQAMGKLGVTRSRQTFGKKQVLGGRVIRQPGIVFVPPSVVERNVQRKPGLDLKNLPKTRVAGTSESRGARARTGRRLRHGG